MPCIERRPHCGEAASGTSGTPTPLQGIGSIIGIISLIFTIIGIIKGIPAVLAFLGAGAPIVGGFLAGVAVLVIVMLFAMDRCNDVKGSTECVSGVVREVVETDFNPLFPFTAMHNRVDLVVKSGYWDVVETNFAKVFCTEDEIPRKSEIIRCYYYTEKVCSAAQGAIVGAALGVIAGLVVAAIVAAAIGCLTIIFCLLAILLAIIIVAALALAGAALGGYAGEQGAGDSTPSDSSGNVIGNGALISVTGNLVMRGDDGNANVFWWVGSTAPHGIISSSTATPYSYCDLDEQLPADSCATIPVIL